MKWLHVVWMTALACTVGASEFSEQIRASFDAGDAVPTEIHKIRDGVEVHYFAPAKPRVPGNNVSHFYIHGGGWRAGSKANIPPYTGDVAQEVLADTDYVSKKEQKTNASGS